MYRDFSAAVWNDKYGACYTFGGRKPPEDNVDTVEAKFKAPNQKTVTGSGWQHGLFSCFRISLIALLQA